MFRESRKDICGRKEGSLKFSRKSGVRKRKERADSIEISRALFLQPDQILPTSSGLKRTVLSQKLLRNLVQWLPPSPTLSFPFPETFLRIILPSSFPFLIRSLHLDTQPTTFIPKAAAAPTLIPKWAPNPFPFPLSPMTNQV